MLRDDVNTRIQAVLEHGFYVNGPEIVELETELSRFVGCEESVGVSSGTDALVIALMALGIGPGDEVIVPGFSYIATAEAPRLLGATPIYVDIDPLTFNIDPSKIEAAVSKRTKAIIIVSLYGQCADYEEISVVASAFDLPVIEDGAQSFGATQNGRKSCNFTTLATTSFFPAKPLGCYGDGGAIFTSDSRLAKLCRQLRAHGEPSRYHHEHIGLNGRLDTIQAAVLLSKLRIFDVEINQRQDIAKRYDEGLEGIPWLKKPELKPGNQSVYAQYTLRLPNRDQIQAKLRELGVPTAVHYPKPIYQQPAYRVDGLLLEECERASKEVLSLPFHPYLAAEEQNKVIDAIKSL